MFLRKIGAELKDWAAGVARKPLVLCGARRVGKTTAVRMFAEGFDRVIELNLEQPADRAIFAEVDSVAHILDAMYFLKSIPRGTEDRTLIFIDEIQSSPAAANLLRRFRAEAPHLFVIAAGSLVEATLDVDTYFPEDEVDLLLIHPLSFDEFLGALGEDLALAALQTIPTPSYAHDKLLGLFRTYLLVGGMPEAVQAYIDSGDPLSVDGVHESLLMTFLNDVEKYASTPRVAKIIRHVIQNGFKEAAGRIRYGGFGNSNYISRDIREAFERLQKTSLFQLVHPVTVTTLPLTPDTKKSPRIHALDTGLVVYKTGMRKEIFSSPDLSTDSWGRILEHVTGQELRSLSSSPKYSLDFWARDKSQSSAVVNYLLPINGHLIPVQVKSGSCARIRSLHAFLNAADHATGARLYEGRFSVEKSKTIDGKEFTLVNLPWYQAARVKNYVEYVQSGAIS